MSSMVETRVKTIALAGNPNCGKTTVFNGLTGATARVGNWPGVTVERRQGSYRSAASEYSVVDLPGIYSLSADSEDERVARDYLISGNVDCIVSIVDAANLERNLYLTTEVLETGIPVIVALNMIDSAEKEGLSIDPEALSAGLGCPVIPLTAVNRNSLGMFKKNLDSYLDKDMSSPEYPVTYNPEVELAAGRLSAALKDTASGLRVNPKFLAVNLLEADEYISTLAENEIKKPEIDAEIKRLESSLNTGIDMLIAEDRYKWITGICDACVKQPESRPDPTGRADKILMHRLWGIPIFIAVMYLVFWITMSIGGAFIDWFDIVFGGIFVDGLGTLLMNAGSPVWLTSIIAGGIGGGIQTVSTFIPIIFVMFFMLAVLEDSGYMSRAAFVMDRAMRAIGLPGKAFVPMLVGFGCTVPAILATRTLESKRDRFMTIFMSPFMSCGARLPVYALFTAAFFGTRSGLVVFSIYMFGIVLAVATGLLLKNSIFKGDYSPFVMELPEYHRPRLGQTAKSAWRRLRIYILRAGKVIVFVVLILAFFNSLGTDGSFGNEDSEESFYQSSERQ